MANNIPRIQSINFFYFIPQAAILLFIIVFFWYLELPKYSLMGVSIYFLLSIYLKVLIPKWHRKGIFLIKKGNLDLAILAFQRSYTYFQKHQWIDKYRAFTMFSTSALSYSEMALMNIVYCFEQLGDKKNAKKFHNILKEKFPENKYS